MNISLNPSYYCNFRCHFCYLTEKQLSNRTLLSIEELHQRLTEIEQYDSIDHVDLYGGEPMLLPDDYIRDLKSCLSMHGIKQVNVNTNLSGINKSFIDPYFYISVSYDFSAREKHEQVWRNMSLLDEEFSVLMLASDQLMKLDPDEMISQFNLLANLSSVEIKPYSTNQANSLGITDRDFELFVQKWIDSTIPKNFDFVNELRIKECLDGNYNAFSDDHVYITPTGKFAVLEFDLNDREYFLELENFEEYIKWANKEKTSLSPICQACEYKGRCLTEHYRYVKSLDNGCNGYKLLLDNYKRKI